MDIIKDNLRIKEPVKKIKKEILVEQSYIIPDSKADIIKNTFVNGNAFVSKIEVQSNKIKIDGSLNVYVLYLDSEEKNNNLDLKIQYSDLVRIDEKFESLDDIEAEASVKIKNLDVKILNERKIQVLASIELEANLFLKGDIEIISDIKDQESIIEKLEEKENIESLVDSKTNIGRVKENIKLTDVEKVVGISKVTYKLLNIENKISYNKVLIKSEIEVDVLYRTDENKLKNQSSTLQFMTFIDISDIKETDICESSIRILNSNINLISNTNIEIEVECEARCNVYENKELSIIKDFYGIKKSYKYQLKEIEYLRYKNIEKIKHNISEKVLIDNINELYDNNLKLTVQNRVYQDNITKFVCRCEVEYIYSLFDSQNIETLRKEFDFEIEKEGDIESIDLEVVNSSFNILPDSSIDTKIEIDALLNDGNSKKIIVMENVEEEEVQNFSPFSIVVYYAQKGDSLWNIAKKFRTTVDEILKINDIKDKNMINIGEKLYIPKAV